MRPLYKLTIISTLVLLSTSCEWISSNSKNKVSVSDSTFVGPRWNLVSYQKENSDATDPGTVGIFVKFEADSSVTGRSFQKEDGPRAGNSFQGRYEILPDNKISIEIFGTTKINEPKGSRYIEFIHELDIVDSFRVQTDQLLLFSEGEKLMVFKKIEK